MSYSLMHGPTVSAAAPYTFFLPHPWVLNAVRVGDLVKLGFDYDPPGEKYSGERMWVQVDRIEEAEFAGRLANQPDEPTATLTYGDEVDFTRDNILDVLLVDETRLPEFVDDDSRYPEVPKRREFWDRCLVDDCVLYDGVPVEYVYREEPEELENDKYPDSGWRVRGRFEDDEPSDREISFVAIGAVLNRDDSWVHLIDAPIGSAFFRDFDTDRYDPVER